MQCPLQSPDFWINNKKYFITHKCKGCNDLIYGVVCLPRSGFVQQITALDFYSAVLRKNQ